VNERERQEAELLLRLAYLNKHRRFPIAADVKRIDAERAEIHQKLREMYP
jgi:hypothetical protein